MNEQIQVAKEELQLQLKIKLTLGYTTRQLSLELERWLST